MSYRTEERPGKIRGEAPVLGQKEGLTKTQNCAQEVGWLDRWVILLGRNGHLLREELGEIV